MPVSRETTNYSIYNAKSVQDFLDYILPSALHWNSASRGELAYRGQASGDWSLIPKAFRAGQLVTFDPAAPRHAPTRVVPQALAEFRAVHQFVRVADGAGLLSTESGGRLLLQEEPQQIFDDPDWAYRWPQEEVLETLALAQHHGIPTRLLDFTEDPLMAAYFAAHDAWDPTKGQRRRGKFRSHLAVWVIDLRFLRAINATSGRYLERIREVRVPRANNSYLHAQFGFFLIDRGANDVMARGESLSIDRATADRARFWHNGNRLSGKGVKDPTWFDELPVRQVRLATANTGQLLKELENRGVTRASIMPSLDRVVEALEFQKTVR